MAHKRQKPEEIVSKLRQVEVLMGQMASRFHAIRQIGLVEETYYSWRKQQGETLKHRSSSWLDRSYT